MLEVTSMGVTYLAAALACASFVLLSLRFGKAFLGGTFVYRKANPAAFWFIVVIFTLGFVFAIGYGAPLWLQAF